jgi:hypothetical protein
MVYVPQCRPSLDMDYAVPGIDPDRPHLRQIHDQAAVTDGVSRDIMPSPTDSY